MAPIKRPIILKPAEVEVLLRVARDPRRPKHVRRSAAILLTAIDTQGPYVIAGRHGTNDREVRRVRELFFREGLKGIIEQPTGRDRLRMGIHARFLKRITPVYPMIVALMKEAPKDHPYWTHAEAARRLGIAKQRFGKICRALGIKFPKEQPANYTEEQLLDAISAVRKLGPYQGRDWTFEAAGRHLKISGKYFSTLCQKFGIPPPLRTSPKAKTSSAPAA